MKRRLQIKVLVREQSGDEVDVWQTDWMGLSETQKDWDSAIWAAIHYHSREIDKLKKEADD